MTGPVLPDVPTPLKSIQHYLKIATTHDQRDVVVSYWCRLYALQTGLKLSTKTVEETNFLSKLIDWLEATKKELHNNEAITNEIAAQAHLENWALKLFLYADKNDRASNFSKSVVQSFFTAGLLYDVITVFGELSDEAVQNRKYAKWKAAYIHNCLKNGETPVPGPVKEEDDSFNLGEDAASFIPLIQPPGTGTNSFSFPSPSSVVTDKPEQITSNPSTPSDNLLSNVLNPPTTELPAGEGDVSLSTEQMTKAQKFIKWAGSALNYDDVPTAVMNLRKALHLLTTGEELA